MELHTMIFYKTMETQVCTSGQLNCLLIGLEMGGWRNIPVFNKC